MDFGLTSEQENFRQELRHWLSENLPEGWSQGRWHPPDEEDERIAFLRDWQRRMYEAGWAGPSWPVEYGGMGATIVEELIYEEELARVNAPRNINALGENFIGPALIELGSDWQKERFLPNILNCEEIWCQGYSEPEYGSDVAGLRTRAERDGDEWIINGQKIWTSNAHFGDWCLLMVRTDFSGTKHEGLTALIVDMGQEGVQPERIRQASDRREYCQVFLDDARTPLDHVVGEVGEGWDVIRTISAYEQAGTRAFELERRLNELIAYCRNTERGGRLLATDPQVQRRLADFDVRIQAAKLTRYRQVSERIDEPIPGPRGTMDNIVSDDMAVELESFAVDLLGPEAALWEDGPESGRWIDQYVGNIGWWIAGGTGDIYRNIVGEHALGLPKDIKSDTTHRRAAQEAEE